MRPIVVDGGDTKKALALKMGAEHFIDFTIAQDCPAQVMQITGVGAHGVFVTAYQAYKGALPPHPRTLIVGAQSHMRSQMLLPTSELVWEPRSCALPCLPPARSALRPTQTC